MSPPPTLSRHSSLADRISSVILPIRPRLSSLRSRRSNASLNGEDNRQGSRHRPYSVYQQSMFPLILRDPDATNKLLEAILDSPGGRRSLSRLARTCKAFMEPVLDILWRDLDSLTPLIGLFPSALLKRARRPGLGLVKNPEPNDWNRLLAYGERVRSISYVESSGAISPSIFPVLEERPRTWMLPNLVALTWKSETAAGLERCRMFLGPSLQSFTIEVGTKHPKLNDVLVEVASHSRLSAFSFTLHTNLPDNFTSIFQHNLALEKVTLAAPGALSSRVGQWAASLPCLRSFQIDLTGRTTTAVEGFFDDIAPGSGWSTPSSVGGTDSGVFSGDEFDFSEMRKSAARLTNDGPRRGAFGQLTHLQLNGDAANVATFLKHITSPLAQIDLFIDDPPAPEDWQDVCALITEHFGYTLQALRISPTPAARFAELTRTTSRGGDAPVRHLPLTHLGRMPRLSRFEIDLPESIAFFNADIAHIARLFPALEILRLCSLARFPPSVGPPPLTLEGIIPLTRHCRRLHTVAVVVNALEGSEETFASLSVSSRSLLRLTVGHSWLPNPLHAAVLLSHLAPHLESLKWHNEKSRAGGVEANTLAWQRVAELLPHLQKIRLHERSQIPKPDIYVPPPTAEKEVDATVYTVDQEIMAVPAMAEQEIQATVEHVDVEIQMTPETESVAIDATPQLVDTGMMFVPDVSEQAVEAREVEETDALSETSDTTKSTISMSSSMLSYLPLPTTGIVNLTYSVVRFYTFPFRYAFSFMPWSSASGAQITEVKPPSSPVPGGLSEDDGALQDEKRVMSDFSRQTDAINAVGL